MSAGAHDSATSELVSVQYLRAIAALMVVFHHAPDQLQAADALINADIGAAGVDLFFVISGLVMTYSIARAPTSPDRFLLRRAVRIVPLYWSVNILLAALLLVAPNVFRTTVFTWDSFIQSLLFIPHENPGAPGALMPMLKLGWTLNYEMFFYLVFATMIGLGPAVRTASLALLFAAFVALVAAFDPAWAPLRFWANSIIFEFIFGCAIGVLLLKGALHKVAPQLWLALLVVAVLALLTTGFADLNAPRYLVWGVPCALIVLACVGLEQASQRPWRNRVLHFLGDASYSIYLIHAYAVVAFRIIWERLGLPVDGWLAIGPFMMLCMGAGVLAGCLTYVLLERPLTTAARHILLPKQRALA